MSTLLLSIIDHQNASRDPGISAFFYKRAMFSIKMHLAFLLCLLLSTFHVPITKGLPTLKSTIIMKLYGDELYKLVSEHQNQTIFRGGKIWESCNLDELTLPERAIEQLPPGVKKQVLEFKEHSYEVIMDLISDCYAHDRISLVCLCERQGTQGVIGYMRVQGPGTMIILEHSTSLKQHMFMSLMMVALFCGHECYVIENKQSSQLRVVLRNRHEFSEAENGGKFMNDIRKKLQEEAGTEDYLQWSEINTDEWKIRSKVCLAIDGNDLAVKVRLFDTEKASFFFENEIEPRCRRTRRSPLCQCTVS